MVLPKRFVLFGALILILGAYFFLQKPSSKELSLNENYKVSKDLKSQLPKTSPDGKDILDYQLYKSPSGKLVLYGTYVKRRGAGDQYDYWLHRLDTKESQNLSSLIKENSEYNKRLPQYTKFVSKETIYIAFDNLWSEDNPAFKVVDGWQVLDEGFWVFDTKTNQFRYQTR